MKFRSTLVNEEQSTSALVTFEYFDSLVNTRNFVLYACED